ncbi:unnamed protein product [Fraxinus pennsylvanica]|uniref:Uncharacterized protein n=1 Tax=Fraxinus pennsylvanica TaxID=56036 RepID=A0AAD1ZWG8_9LAMI|nr:unnamed protein product [Fraxinus pennsylvanica]
MNMTRQIVLRRRCPLWIAGSCCRRTEIIPPPEVAAESQLGVGLCRKALRLKRCCRLIKNGLLPPRKCGCDDKELQILTMSGLMVMVNALELDNNVAELEKEMWEKFYGAGFWRSSSQRSET